MSGGSEGSYGTAGGPPFPADQTEDEHSASALGDSEGGEGEGARDDDPPESLASGSSDDEIPRHTKPFRAWGAAYEPRPSLWGRFRGWLSGLFRRKHDEVVEEPEPEVVRSEAETETSPIEPVAPAPDDFSDHAAAPAAMETHSAPSDLPDADPTWDVPTVAPTAAPPAEAISGTDLDFVWSPKDRDADAELILAESHVEPEEPKRPSFISRLFGRKKKREIAEAEPALDGVHAHHDDAAVDEPVRMAADAEPAVDDFAVAGSDGDGDVTVESESPATADDGDAAPSAPPHAGDFDWAEAAAEIPEKRPSFIARLFGKKPKAADRQAEEIDSAIADLDVVEAGIAPAPDAPLESELDESRSPSEPADDFADASEVAQLPQAAISPPSLEHSADDAAQLADFLAASYVPPAAPEAIQPAFDADSPTAAMPEVESAADFAFETAQPEVVEVESVEVEGVDVVQRSTDAIDLPLETIEDVPAIVLPEPPSETKKPGFFSSLLIRVSKLRMPAVKDADIAAVDAALPAETVAEVSAEPSIDAPAESVDADISRWAPPAAASVVEQQPVANFGTTAPMPAWRDARDDPHEDDAATEVEAVDSGRVTEAVPQPVEAFDEGEKTDEFEVVPGLPDPASAETQTLAPGIIGRLFGKTKLASAVTTDGSTPAAAGAAAAAEDKAPFVLAKFRMFYNEVIRDKHQKSDVISGFATAIVSAAAADMADPEFAAALLSKRLSEMLELQAAESNWTGGDAPKYYPEAQYAMVALADETFLHMEWPGRSKWAKHMLEPRMFNTRMAGTELFRRIDKMLREPNPPKGARDLARVYLLVLASGFRGMFREPNLHRPVAEYRRRLYEYAHGNDPLMLYAKDRQVFPEAAAFTLAGRAVGRFSGAQKWIATVVILVLGYGVVSHLAWKKLSVDLKDAMSRIESSTTGDGKR